MAKRNRRKRKSRPRINGIRSARRHIFKIDIEPNLRVLLKNKPEKLEELKRISEEVYKCFTYCYGFDGHSKTQDWRVADMFGLTTNQVHTNKQIAIYLLLGGKVIKDVHGWKVAIRKAKELKRGMEKMQKEKMAVNKINKKETKETMEETIGERGLIVMTMDKKNENKGTDQIQTEGVEKERSSSMEEKKKPIKEVSRFYYSFWCSLYLSATDERNNKNTSDDLVPRHGGVLLRNATIAKKRFNEQEFGGILDSQWVANRWTHLLKKRIIIPLLKNGGDKKAEIIYEVINPDDFDIKEIDNSPRIQSTLDKIKEREKNKDKDKENHIKSDDDAIESSRDLRVEAEFINADIMKSSRDLRAQAKRMIDLIKRRIEKFQGEIAILEEEMAKWKKILDK